MAINREKLTTHLDRLHLGGLIGEAVLIGAYSAAAVDPGQQIVVVVPELKKVEPLSDPVGVTDLSLLIKSLRALKDAGGGDVGLEFEDDRIVVAERFGGKISIVTAEPSTIVTALKEETVEAVVAQISDEENRKVIPLQQDVVKGVLETTSLLSAGVVKIKVGKGRTKGSIQVGEDEHHNSEFVIKELKDDAMYELTLEAKVLNAVFKTLTNWSSSNLILTGPDSVVGIVTEDDEAYKYILSPVAEDA